MKNNLTLLAIILLMACDNNKKDTETTVATDTTQTGNTTEPKSKDLQQIKTELAEMQPLDDDALKATLPEKLLDAERSDIEISMGMGAKSAIARYVLNDTMNIKLEVIDCGGPAGSGIFSTQYAGQEETAGADEEVTLSVSTFKGQKGFESCLKERPRDCMFTWFDGTRYLVFVEGTNTGIDKLKQAAGELNFK